MTNNQPIKGKQPDECKCKNVPEGYFIHCEKHCEGCEFEKEFLSADPKEEELYDKNVQLRDKVNPIIGEIASVAWYTARNELEKSFLTVKELDVYSDKFVALIRQELASERKRFLDIIGEDEEKGESEYDYKVRNELRADIRRRVGK